MADYSKGLIYAITCRATGRIYIGSTTNLAKRMSRHRSKTNNCTSALVLAGGDYYEEVLEYYASESRYTLELRETVYIRQYRVWHGELCVNDCLAAVTPEERRDANKVYGAAVYAAHRDERKVSHAAYRAAHRDEAKVYHAAYRATHRDEAKVRNASYQAAHRAEIQAHQNSYRAACAAQKRLCDSLNLIQI